MLNRLHVQNIRRHADTTIDFGTDAQLILLDGGNGAGKTTLLEAIQWALFGYTRHGRGGFGRMIRRGSEHEGMSVTLDFTVADITYQVIRRWEKGKATAILSVNDVPTHRGVEAVNNEIAAILGVDATGFLLSSVATQEDRSELGSLSPTKRRAAITKLFRYDAYTVARNHARDTYNEATGKVKALTDVINRADEDNLEALRASASRARHAVTVAQTALAELDTRLGDTADVVAAHQQATIAYERARITHTNAADALAEAHAAVTAAHAQLVDPGPKPDVSADQVEADLRDVSEKIADATGQQRTREHVDALVRARANACTALERARSTLTTIGHPDQLKARSKELSERIVEQQDVLAAARESLQVAAARRSELANEHRNAVAALAQANELDATCTACGQHVDEHTRETQQQNSRTHLEQTDGELAQSEKNVTACQRNVRDAETLLEALRGQASELSEQVAVATRAADDDRDAQQTITDHDRTIEALNATLTDVSLSDLYAQRAHVETVRATITAYQHNLVRAQNARERLAEATARLDAAVAREEHTRAEAQAAQVSDELTAAAERWAQQSTQRQQDAEFLAALRSTADVCDERVKAAEHNAAALQAAQEQLIHFRAQATVASKAVNVLAHAAKLAAAATRPALQADITDLLALMSNNRFTAVALDDDYTITVQDSDGAWVPMEEFSGGEIDLIALAVRLALARRVSTSNTGGFLILDEVFGSQDADRCTAIINALRNLRDIYGQILLISHVGGLTEGADRVVSVQWDRDTNLTTAA